MVEEATGHRPLPSSLRSMASRGRMPAPVHSGSGVDSQWDADQIASWLRYRDSAQVEQIQARITDAHAKDDADELRRQVRRARKVGLNWEQIAHAIPGPHGGPITKQAAYKRFKDL